MAIDYRPLDRSRNEIRLLKILPPENPSTDPNDPLSFSSDMVRCELQYDSLDTLHAATTARDTSLNMIFDYIFQDIPRNQSGDGETDIEALMDTLRRRLRGTLRRQQNVL